MNNTPKQTKQEREQAQEHAREYLERTLKPGMTVYTVNKHTSASGMLRHISAYIVQDGKIVDISWFVAHLLDWKRDCKTGGIKVGGCGMDMGFHLVYTLSYVVFKDAEGLERSDKGYALNQQWL